MLPKNIHSGFWPYGHCQGIAVDTKREFMYYSFTTALVKTDMQGNLIGYCTGLLGHLGCIAFNDADGRVYGSLEYKNDAIGRGILSKAGHAGEITDAFYIARFDVWKIDRPDMDACADGTASVRFRFRRNGRIIADDQIDLADARAADVVSAPAKPWYALAGSGDIGYAEDGETVSFAAKGMKIAFSKKTGMPCSIRRKGWFGGTELLKTPLRLDAFRTPSSNELGPASKWLQHGLRNLEAELQEMSPVDQAEGALTFTTRVVLVASSFRSQSTHSPSAGAVPSTIAA